MLVCDINGRRLLADITELITHAMTPSAQEAAPPPGTAQPEGASLPPHIPRVLVLKSEALAAHLASSVAAGAAASEAVGAGSAASATSAGSILTQAEPASPAQASPQASPQAPAQPVVTRILLVAFLALLIARRLRRP